MSTIDFRSFNLNLVPALDALLQTRAVGRAAQRMGVSQSAMSHSLARLREQLDDPLLVPQGRILVPTPRAERLAAELPALLERLRSTLGEAEAFDPGRAELSLSIATVDYFELTALPTLMAELAVRAPGIRLNVERLSPASVGALQRGELDMILGGSGLVEGSGLERAVLYDDDFRVMVRAGHPTIGRRLGLDRYLEARHLVVRFEGRGPGLVDRVLARRELRREVALWVPHFMSAPLIVAESDLICTIASTVAVRARELFGVKLHAPPLELPRAPVTMWWPRAHGEDPARRWFRSRLLDGSLFPPSLARKVRAHGPTP